MKAPQLHVIEPARKTEDEIEAEYAGEVYGIDPDHHQNECPLPGDSAEIDIYEGDEPAPRGPRMG